MARNRKTDIHTLVHSLKEERNQIYIYKNICVKSIYNIYINIYTQIHVKHLQISNSLLGRKISVCNTLLQSTESSDVELH